MPLFRENLLRDLGIALAGRSDPSIAAALEQLGARVVTLDEGLDEAAAQAWTAELAPLRALVCDVRSAFLSSGLSQAMQGAWAAVRAVAVRALIPAEAGGKIVLVGPSGNAGRHAGAARAGLENLARTLSVEWARYRITVTAIAPGAETSAAELAELVCFLASPAGDYFSGCRFELGLIRAS